MAGTKYVDFRAGGNVLLHRDLIGNSSTDGVRYDDLVEFQDKDGYRCFGLVKYAGSTNPVIVGGTTRIDADVLVGRLHTDTITEEKHGTQGEAGIYVLGEFTQEQANALSEQVVAYLRDKLGRDTSFTIKPLV